MSVDAFRQTVDELAVVILGRLAALIRAIQSWRNTRFLLRRSR